MLIQGPQVEELRRRSEAAALAWWREALPFVGSKEPCMVNRNTDTFRAWDNMREAMMLYQLEWPDKDVRAWHFPIAAWKERRNPGDLWGAPLLVREAFRRARRASAADLS